MLIIVTSKNRLSADTLLLIYIILLFNEYEYSVIGVLIIEKISGKVDLLKQRGISLMVYNLIFFLIKARGASINSELIDNSREAIGS